jgi:hypothetical protein
LSKPVLTVIFGDRDLAMQAAHLARGALFLPEPEPLPEPFAEIVLRVETASGSGVDLEGRVLQILAGRGIAIAFDDAAGAKTKLAPLFAENVREEEPETPTFVFWGRGGGKKTSFPPAASVPSPEEIEEAPEPELDEAAKIQQQIAGMTSAQKMQLAMHGDRTARLLLLKDVNKTFQTFILQNARITLDEVRYIAGFRQASPDVLNTIAAHRDWGNNPNIASALVRNPKTPGATAAKLVEKLPIAEARRLAKANDVPRAVTVAARKRVADGA